LENDGKQNPRSSLLLSRSHALEGWFGNSQRDSTFTRRAFQTLVGAYLEKAKTDGEARPNHARMNGEPRIRNLRLTVRRVLDALAIYPDRAELKREYPELEDEDIRQVLAFAATLLDDKVLPLPHSR
jgi:uncharacterized protein (DUF433 family)